MLRFLAAVIAAGMLVPALAHAQFLPDRGPSTEQQEFASAVLLGPEATLLGAFLVGGGAYVVTKECCTGEDEDVAIEPMAIGAGIGAAIGTIWAVRSICDHFHPGSDRNLVLGATLGAGVGAGLFFFRPENEDDNDAVLRLVSFLFLPTLAAYAGWHVESGGMYFGDAAAPPAWAGHVGPVRERRGSSLAAVSVRF